MIASELLVEAARTGGRLAVKCGRLGWQAARGALTPKPRAALEELEADLLDLIPSEPVQVAQSGPRHCLTLLADWPDTWRDRWGMPTNFLKSGGLNLGTSPTRHEPWKTVDAQLLDRNTSIWENHGMKRARRFTDQIRDAVDQSGLTRYRIYKMTGIDQSTLSRFMAGKSGFTLKSLDKLADALGLRVVANGLPKQRKEG
jgi:predicted XRE-type DNA-binding protein